MPSALEESSATVQKGEENELVLRCWADYCYESASPPKNVVVAQTFWTRLETDLADFFKEESPFRLSRSLADRVSKAYFSEFTFGVSEKRSPSNLYFTGIKARQQGISTNKPPVSESSYYNLLIFWSFHKQIFAPSKENAEVKRISHVVNLFLNEFPEHRNQLRENIDDSKAEEVLKGQPFVNQPDSKVGFLLNKE